MATINGREFQHATIKLSAGGAFGSFDFKGFTKLDYEVGAEKKPVNRADGKTDGYTIDNEKNSGSLGMRLSEWLRFKEQVQQSYPDQGIGEIEFDFTVTYGNSLSALKTDKLRGVMFQKESRTSQANQEVHVIEIPLFILEVEPHGGAFIRYAQ